MVTPRERWSGSVFEPITIAAAVRAMSGTVPVSLPIPSSIPSPWIRNEGSRLASSVAKANGVTRPSTASWNSSADVLGLAAAHGGTVPTGRRRRRPRWPPARRPERRRRRRWRARLRSGPRSGGRRRGRRRGSGQIRSTRASPMQISGRSPVRSPHRPRIGSRRWRGTIVERTVEIDRIGVFLREVEGEGPPTVFVHGNPTNSADWLPFLERRRGPGDRVRPAGLGRSARPDPLAFDGTFGAHANLVEAPARSGRAGRLPPRRPRLGRDRADPRSATPRAGRAAGDHARGAVAARLSLALDRADLATSRRSARSSTRRRRGPPRRRSCGWPGRATGRCRASSST